MTKPTQRRTEYAPADVERIAEHANRHVYVAAGFAAADAATVAEFAAWLDDHRIPRAAFDAAVAAEGVDDWRDLPTADETGIPLHALSDCVAGAEAIHWWQLGAGDVLGLASGGFAYHVPHGEPMPLIAGYDPVPQTAEPD